MSQIAELSVVILAAGKGTRMKSAKAKVLHEVFFRPMIHHVLETVKPLSPSRCIVIVGHQEERVSDSLRGYDAQLVRQEQQLGTGHAVQMAREAIPETEGVVMILCGDTPLVTTTSLQAMHRHHVNSGSVLTVMTTSLDDPTGYGRIISDGNNILAIVEEKEANEQQKKIKEINAGIYLVDRQLLFEALETLTPDNAQGEFYLTDIVEYVVTGKRKAEKFHNPNPLEVLGVNSRVELEAAHKQLQLQRNKELMQQGITIYNSETITVSPFARIGSDTIIMPGAYIAGNTSVGKSCIIGNNVVLMDCTIGDDVRVGAGSILNNCVVEKESKISPLTARDR